MSFSPHHYCKKCRTCNTLTCSTLPEASSVDATLCQESGVGACLGSGDAFATGGSVDKTLTEQFGQVNLDRRTTSHYVSSSGTPNTPLSDSSTPLSDGDNNYSDNQAKPSLPKDSLLQYLHCEEDTKTEPTKGHFPLQDRSVVGQEKSPISGAASGTSISGGSSSSLRGTSEMAPKERRRWVRPPLVGQAASNTDVKILSDGFELPEEEDSIFDESLSKTTESDALDCSVGSREISSLKHGKLQSSSSNESGNNMSVSKSTETGDSADENLAQVCSQTIGDAELGMLSDSCIGGKASPSSSIASHKRLEWDSGADVGYQDYQNVGGSGRNSVLKLSAIERLALIQNTDKAYRMRLDPEGTSSSVPSTGNNPTPTFNTYPLTLQHLIGQPSAESTPSERASSPKTQRQVGTGSLGISPITVIDISKQARFSGKHFEEECKDVEETEEISPRQHSVPRTRSASLLNLSTAVVDPSQYLYLYRSQSDPDISADAGNHTDDSLSRRFSPRKPVDKRGLDTHSLSSGSSNTLIHVPTKGSKYVSKNILSDQATSHDKQTRQPQRLAEVLNSHQMTRSIPSKEISISKELTVSKGYTCSDNDHRQGLHHHYGILCSSSLVIPSDLTSHHCPKQAEIYNAPGSRSSSANSSNASSSHSESFDSRQRVKKKNIARKKVPSQERSSSASPPIDTMFKGTSTYVDKATSFEYLPGHVYESELADGKSSRPAQQEQYRHYSKQVSSGSTSGDLPSTSGKNQLSHVKRKVAEPSSSDSETDLEGALWLGPRAVARSCTLVRDVERGVNLLRGIVFTNPHKQREIVERVVRRIVEAEYTDDVLERRMCRHKRNPFSEDRFYGVQQLPSLSTKTESEPRIRSAPVSSSRRVQSSIVLKAPFLKNVETNKHADTGSERSDTLYSAADDSSSLQSSSVNESQKSVATESTTNQGTIRANDNPINETQPPSLSSNPSNTACEQSSHLISEHHSNPASDQPSNPASDRPSNPASDRSSNPASDQPSNPASDQPSNPASDRPSNPASDRSSNPASDQPSNPASDQPSNPASAQPSNPASDPSSNPASNRPSEPASNQPSNPASERPSKSASKRPSNAASGQPSNSASVRTSASDPPSDLASERHSSNPVDQSVNHSPNTNECSLRRAPTVVNVATVTTKAATIDASTTTNQAMGGAVSYGTLSSVVSITPMTITVQSAPASAVAVPMGGVVASQLPVSVASSKATVNASTMSKETANVATMTSPPSCAAAPTSSAVRPGPVTCSEAGIADGIEPRDTREKRRARKNAGSGHTEQQLQMINRDITYLKNLQKMLRNHPQVVVSSPMEQGVPSSHSASRKAKERNCQTSEDNMEYVHRHRLQSHSRAQDDRTEKQSVLKRTIHELSSADSRSTVTSSSMLSTSSASASNSAPNTYACGAGDLITSSRETTEEDQRHHRPQQSHKTSRKHREPSPESEDSVTRAVTHVVSSRVKALRNLGQIEEAEVKIRVRMGQPSDAEALSEKSTSRQHMDAAPKISISQERPSRTLKSSREPDDYESKRVELDELIARQRAMDAETKKKLQLLNEMRENVRRTTLGVKGVPKVDQRDACTVTSVDTATNTTPLNSATHVVSRSTQKESTVESSSESAPKRSSCPACRVRAATRKRPEDVPMCRHDPGFTAGQPRGRQRPPISYFLKVEEEEVAVRAETPPRMPSLQVVTVKVPRPVRPPSSLGSSGSVSSSSSSSRHSPVRSRTAPGLLASSVRAFSHDSRSPPETRKKRSPKRPARREVMLSRSEPELGRGDANFLAESSSDEHTAHDTLQDHLVNNYPNYIEAAERRRQWISEMSYLRRLRQESRKRLVQLKGDAWLEHQNQMRTQKPSTAPAKPASRPKPSGRSMRLASAKRYARALEVEQKELEKKKQEDNRTNRLLQAMFTRKLREKALRGQTTLRSSVSVISSL